MMLAAVPLTTPTAHVNTTLRETDASRYVRAQEVEQKSRHFECGKIAPSLNVKNKTKQKTPSIKYHALLTEIFLYFFLFLYIYIFFILYNSDFIFT